MSMQASRSVATTAMPPPSCTAPIAVAPVDDRAARCRQAEQRAEAAAGELVDVADDELDADRLGAGRQHGDRLRMGVVVHDEPCRRRLRQPAGHRHRLGRGRRLVEQRRVGHLEAGELGDHRLEVEQRLEAALADLGLVGRVRRVPRRVLEHVALDDARRDRAVVAHADQAGARLVLGGEVAQLGEHLGLGPCRGQVERGVVGADGGGDRLVEQILERVGADHVEHRRELGGGRADVTAGEAVVDAGARRREGIGCGHAGCSSARRGRTPPLFRHLRASVGPSRPFPVGEPCPGTGSCCFPALPRLTGPLA